MRRFTMGLAIATMISTPGCELATSFDGYSATRDAHALDGSVRDGGADTGADAARDAAMVDGGVRPDAFVLDTGPRPDTGEDGCVVDVVATCAGRCGSVTDPICGVSVNCGDPCVLPETCGGGAGPTFCGCVADAVATTCSGRCGTVANNCGTPVDCGNPCVLPETCAGGGVANVCGCTVTGNACSSLACGATTDSCGNTVHCDSCGGGSHCDERCDMCLSGTQMCP